VSAELLSVLTIFVLAILVGFEVISKVPATLHTPLMSGANSIHGIVLVGAMFIAANATELLGQLLAFVAVVFAAMNVVGGYVVTDRMLQMFKRRPAAGRAPAGAADATGAAAGAGSSGAAADTGSSGTAAPAAGAPDTTGGRQA
jgi:NAD(P) transhydrogenase subunit alpha